VATWNFWLPHHWKISNSVRFGTKKKTSLESFMFFLGIRKLIPSRSRPSFEVLLWGLESPFCYRKCMKELVAGMSHPKS
jgi:hypothetical protein